MNCSHCNQVLAASAKFCNHCGMSQSPAPASPAPAATPTRVCECCQAICKPQAKFCPQCGHTLGQAAPVAANSGVIAEPTASSTGNIEPGLATEKRPHEAAQVPAPPIQAAEPRAAKASQPTSRTRWLPWAMAAVVLLGGGLAWLLLKPASHTTAASGAQPTAAQVPEATHDDRAKAEALVGPLNSTPEPLPAAAPSTAVEAPADPATAQAMPATAPASPASTEPSPSRKPSPPPAKPTPKPERQASPTLKDLLD